MRFPFFSLTLSTALTTLLLAKSHLCEAGTHLRTPRERALEPFLTSGTCGGYEQGHRTCKGDSLPVEFDRKGSCNSTESTHRECDTDANRQSCLDACAAFSNDQGCCSFRALLVSGRNGVDPTTGKYGCLWYPGSTEIIYTGNRGWYAALCEEVDHPTDTLEPTTTPTKAPTEVPTQPPTNPSPADSSTSFSGPPEFVMVTSDTCALKGYGEVSSQAACEDAVDHVHVVGLAQGIFKGCRIEKRSDGPVVTFNQGGNSVACTHDYPCVCQVIQHPPSPVCTNSGDFRPDTKQYFTIKSPNGRYLAAARTFGRFLHDPIIRTPIDGDNDLTWLEASIQSNPDELLPNDQRLHWRFDDSLLESDGLISIINRATGKYLTDNTLTRFVHDTGNVDGSILATTTGNFRHGTFFQVTCTGSHVEIETVIFGFGVNLGLTGTGPIDCCEGAYGNEFLAEIRENAAQPLAFTEKQSPGYFFKQTSCGGSCNDFEPSGSYETVQEGRSNCIIGKRRTCRASAVPPTSMAIKKQRWLVEVLPDSFDLAVGLNETGSFDSSIVRRPLLAERETSSILGGEAATLIGEAVAGIVIEQISRKIPILGTLFAFAGTTAFSAALGKEELTIQDLASQVAVALQKLEERLLQTTELMVANGVADSSIEIFRQSMRSHRNFFLNEYPGEKHLAIEDEANVPSRVDNRAEQLLAVVNLYQGDIFKFFGDAISFDPSDLTDVLRVHLGLESFKLAITEVFTMEMEGLLLKKLSVLNTNLSCEQLFAVKNVAGNIALFKDALIQAQDTVRTFGLANLNDFLDSFGCRDFGIPLPREFCQIENDAKEARLEEYLFDVETVSYPIDVQLRFLDNFEEDFLERCAMLDSDPIFRSEFQTDTVNLAALRRRGLL